MRCLIVEDDRDTATFIERGMKEAGYSVSVCTNGVDGMAAATHEAWDAIILDRGLPGHFDGLSILSTLRTGGQRTPVLVVSALSSVDERVKGLRAGGDDYVTKPFSMVELAARVEALVRRAQTNNGLAELKLADLTLDLRSRKVTRGNQSLTLQPREFRLLEYLLRHAGQVVTRTMLLEGVWDCHFDPQTNVIDVQISRLRNKVDRGFQPPLIHTIRGAGYRLAIDDQRP